MSTTTALDILRDLRADIATSSTLHDDDREYVNTRLDAIIGELVANNAPSINKPRLIVKEDEVAGKVLACPECGGTELQYVESYLTWRSMDTNQEGRLVFDGDFKWESGDDTPGVCCANWSCMTELDSTGVEVDFS